MALARVQGFLASDGKFFFGEHRSAAEEYEAQLQFHAWCATNICVA
jgi:hypothetical protein